MFDEKYVPNGPYILKNGKRKGKSLEELMFENYSWLDFMLKNMNFNLKEFSKLNNLHLHLRWLMARGEDRKTNQVCPHCGVGHVKFFAYSYKEKNFFMACDKIICRGEILAKASSHPLKFSSVLDFNSPSRPYVLYFLKKIFLLDHKDLTAEKLFNFFSAQNPST